MRACERAQDHYKRNGCLKVSGPSYEGVLLRGGSPHACCGRESCVQERVKGMGVDLDGAKQGWAETQDLPRTLEQTKYKMLPFAM
eukprot:2401064-Amphidinium_carterae.1